MNQESSSSHQHLWHHPPPPQPNPYPQATNPIFQQPNLWSSSSTTLPPPDMNYRGERWAGGIHVMGTPASNQKPASMPSWEVVADGHQKGYQHQPYIQNAYAPVDSRPTSAAPLDVVRKRFKSLAAKAESTAHNIMGNIKTGSSATEAVRGKVYLRAKTITGGGFDAIYKESFGLHPNEMLKKTFACYLSTSTGPVAGTLYLSTLHVAFCSDLPSSSFTAPSGQQISGYNKILIPLVKIGKLNPVTMGENSDTAQRYLQLISTDGYDFWFTGFVNYDKACRHLYDSLSSFAPAVSPQPPFPMA